MKRREFIALLGGAAASAPFVARAQRPKTATIGILNFENPEPFRTMLRDGLRDLGYVENGNLRLEFRSAEGERDRLVGIAAELVGLKVDVLVAYPTPAVVASKQATREIPIVMLAAGDPLGTGLVESLARPGGNITGTSSTTAESGSKTLELVRDILPSVLFWPARAARSLGRTPRHSGDLLPARIRRCRRPDQLWTELCSGLPPDRHVCRKNPGGCQPSDLPVLQPTKLELVINLKTAKALGLAVPPTLLAGADEVIE